MFRKNCRSVSLKCDIGEIYNEISHSFVDDRDEYIKLNNDTHKNKKL